MIPTPDANIPIVKRDGAMLDDFSRLIVQIINMQTITGQGSPDGVVEAHITRLYMDETGAPGSVLYIKQLADIGKDRTLGWVAIG